MTFIVNFYIDNQPRLIEVESKDKINAVIDAIWPVTVWSKEEWDSVERHHVPERKVSHSPKEDR